ncbi:hypothetical protein TNCV_4752261 [Trichonephila clavipes]|nr:hypothetical protein TNCV_4752261 [Trichonephila clavipes]
MPVHFSPSSNRKEPTQLLQDDLFPTSTFNKPHLSPTSQRKPGCSPHQGLSQAPLTSMIWDRGSLREPYAQRQRRIINVTITRRL